MNQRDIKSLDTITKEQLELLQRKKVGIVGAGGLGGYVIEMLSRFGVSYIRIIDQDVFEESNLNRQLLSTELNIGSVKVEEAKKRVNRINKNIKVDSFYKKFDTHIGDEFLQGLDIVLDCVDNVQTRLLLEKLASKHELPLIHGAVGAWVGQVSTVLPGDNTLASIYDNGEIEMPAIAAASFIPALVASYQVAETVKVLTKSGNILHKKMMYFDLLSNQIFIVDLEEE